MTDDGKKKGSGNGRKESKTNADECISLFMKGLDTSDTAATSSSLRALGALTEEECRSVGKENAEIICDLSSFASVLEAIKSGNEDEERRFQWSFNPFLGTPEEMLEVFGEAPCGWKAGITPVVEGTTEYIRRFLSYPEELRSRAGAYLTGWLMRLVDVISGKITDLMEDKNEKIWDMDATGACVLADFLTVLITGNGFGEVTGRAFDLFGDSIKEAEKRSPGPLSPLNGAVSVGDITTFDKLWAYDDIRELVKKKRGDGGDENGEPGEDGEESEEYSFHSPKLTLYPAKSLQMLDRLYTLGLLLP